MTDEQKAAYIMAQAAGANAEALGMAAENMQRAALGQSMAYSKDCFNLLERKYIIGHNDVIERAFFGAAT